MDSGQNGNGGVSSGFSGAANSVGNPNFASFEAPQGGGLAGIHNLLHNGQ